MAKVLIVEDDEVIAQGMTRHLSAAGFDPMWVANGEQGLARLRYEQPAVCILDLMLPGLDGWKLIETVRGEGIGTPILVTQAGPMSRPILAQLGFREVCEIRILLDAFGG